MMIQFKDLFQDVFFGGCTGNFRLYQVLFLWLKLKRNSKQTEGALTSSLSGATNRTRGSIISRYTYTPCHLWVAGPQYDRFDPYCLNDFELRSPRNRRWPSIFSFKVIQPPNKQTICKRQRKVPSWELTYHLPVGTFESMIFHFGGICFPRSLEETPAKTHGFQHSNQSTPCRMWCWQGRCWWIVCHRPTKVCLHRVAMVATPGWSISTCSWVDFIGGIFVETRGFLKHVGRISWCAWVARFWESHF